MWGELEGFVRKFGVMKKIGIKIIFKFDGLIFSIVKFDYSMFFKWF